MVAIKEDEIILQGIINYLDGLWGIPIETPRMQSNNYNNPTLHSFQYKNNRNNNIKSDCDMKST